MYQYILIRQEDLPNGKPGWRITPAEDNSGWFFNSPLVDWDYEEIDRIAAKMEVGEQKILKI